MPVICRKDGEGYWNCRWGRRGKTYRSKSKADAQRKAAAQGAAAYASGYKGK